jgi:hypothetical protein
MRVAVAGAEQKAGRRRLVICSIRGSDDLMIPLAAEFRRLPANPRQIPLLTTQMTPGRRVR